MAHGVQTDDVGGAIGRALGPADGGTGQRIHQIQAESERLGVVHDGGHRKHADAVGDEVGGVLGPHHALAQGADQEGFQQIEDGRIGGRAGNQFCLLYTSRCV